MYEARQNKPQVPRTFSSLCKKEYEHQFQTKNNEKQNSCVKVIQYGKRKNAIEHTINNRIVRGNIVIDVVKTKGFNIYLLSNFRKDQNNILNYLIQNQIISDNSLDKYLAISYLIAFLQIGNCGEFADFVMTSLAVKTDDKKRSKYAFRCSLGEKTQNGNNMDHAFNMTYNTNMKPQTNLSVQGEDVDKLKKEAIVLDAWDNYSIMTLDRFLNNGNPYRNRNA